MPASVPNDRLAGLVAALGRDDTRELVALYLDSYPGLVAEISSSDAIQAERAAHSLKSSSQQMGLPALAKKLAALEGRLRSTGEAATPAEIEVLNAEYALAEGPLRAFVRD
jgi:HPt (histidine-containing phosphotransfer) domain-containing protein